LSVGKAAVYGKAGAGQEKRIAIISNSEMKFYPIFIIGQVEA
jgi:hypothetical protein